MNWLNLPPLEAIAVQTAFFRSTARFIAADCGRRSGKTERAFRRTLKCLFRQHPTADHPKYLWGLPTEDQARNTIWGKFQSSLDPLYRRGIVRYKNLNIEIQTGRRPDGTPTSSILLVRGMMNPFRVEGEGYYGAVLDEMSDMPPSAYGKSVFPAISDRRCNGWAMLLGVPKVRGIGASAFRAICEKWDADPDPQYARFHWTSDLVLPPETIAEARKQLDEKTFREQFMASWETASGRVYYAFSRKQNVAEGMEPDPNEPLLIGCDFNVSPMSWVVCQAPLDDSGSLKSGGTIRVLDELRIYDTWTQEALDVLWERWGHHPAGFVFYGDAAGQHNSTNAMISDWVIIEQDSRFFRNFNDWTEMYFPAANPYVADRVASVNSILRNAAGTVRCKINKSCEYLIKDLEDVVWLENVRKVDARDHERTHMADALGYLIHEIAPIGFDFLKNEPPC